MPVAASEPTQPSPVTPPLAVHPVAPGASHDSGTVRPCVCAPYGDVKLRRDTEAAATTVVPVLDGSSTDFRVVVPVVLVLSAVEFHMAARDVKSAEPFEPFGAGGLGAGQDS